MPTSTGTDPTPEWVKGDLPGDELDSAREAQAAPEPAAEPTPAGQRLADGEPAGQADSALADTKTGDTEPAAPPEADSNGRERGPELPEAHADGEEPVVPRLSSVPPEVSLRDYRLQKLEKNGDLDLEALIESLLFVADGAVPISRLAEALDVPTKEVEAALAGLQESYARRGLSVQRFRDRVQLTTAPGAANMVERFLGLAATTPLSRAALETLAIIAYRQPVTRPQIEAVRGVNSDSVIKNLLTKGLVEESGRAEGPGRPVLYSTTSEFMQHFGLTSLGDLPPLSLPTPAEGEPDSASPVQILKG